MIHKTVHTITTLLAALTLLCMLPACGSKRNPTGGPQDTVKPKVLGSSPAEFGAITNGVIEISFSKEMDKSTLANSIYIYPPVLNKKVSMDKATLRIKLGETLKPNTNYFVTLSTRLKDSRGNPLENNQTLVFRNGDLNNYRISGTISYEQPSDVGLPIELSLVSADSLLVLSNRISGEAYTIESLNPQAHLLRAYIDKNLNGRYDFGLDPFFEGLADGKSLSTLNMSIAYADSSKPRIRRVLPVSNREIHISLSEQVKSYHSVKVLGVNPVTIKHQILEQDKISIICTAMDSTEYTLQLNGVEDFKGNQSEVLEAKFHNYAAPDTIAPTIVNTNPRNGASVNNLLPVLELHFSELIPAANVHAKLFSGNELIPLKQLTEFGRVHRFQPTKELVNYRSCILKVLNTTSDFSGNKMKQEYELQFLPLMRDK
ncbi:MAG: hypothetical protein CVU50_08020 [Candidatus Cloacimonetes bacterium HGW-Cloacimonetes-3]|jgi:hypothetical protein|nr:MAG: hypothetical protein CVU50_08020 [Candidatus Cloacimonetes bacterium HGW-Cloacimonetes-3]